MRSCNVNMNEEKSKIITVIREFRVLSSALLPDIKS